MLSFDMFYTIRDANEQMIREQLSALSFFRSIPLSFAKSHSAVPFPLPSSSCSAIHSSVRGFPLISSFTTFSFVHISHSAFRSCFFATLSHLHSFLPVFHHFLSLFLVLHLENLIFLATNSHISLRLGRSRVQYFAKYSLLDLSIPRMHTKFYPNLFLT